MYISTNKHPPLSFSTYPWKACLLWRMVVQFINALVKSKNCLKPKSTIGQHGGGDDANLAARGRADVWERPLGWEGDQRPDGHSAILCR